MHLFKIKIDLNEEIVTIHEIGRFQNISKHIPASEQYSLKNNVLRKQIRSN